MHTPGTQLQQGVHHPITAQVSSQLFEDNQLYGREEDIFDAALQTFGLSPSLRVDVSLSFQSDGTEQWHIPEQQMHAQELNTEGFPSQHSFDQQILDQQFLYEQNHHQQSLNQSLFNQRIPVQETPVQGMSVQQMHVHEMSAQELPAPRMHRQSMWTQQTFQDQTAMEQVRTQHTSIQQRGRFPVPQLPASVAPPHPASICTTSELRSGFKLCINCHESFDVSRNHGMACLRHKVDKPLVDDRAVAWQVWNDRPGELENAPWVRVQFPDAFVWPCCRRSGGAPGCTSEAHVPEAGEEFVMKAVIWAINGEGHEPEAE